MSFDHNTRLTKMSDKVLKSDVNSHQNIFNSILNQISGNSEYEIPFLHLLQHLLSIEYKREELPAIIWDSAEALVKRATTSIKSREDAEKLLKLIEKRRSSVDMLSKGSLEDKSQNKKCSETNGDASIPRPPPPPPPPPSISLTLASPPPPPPPPPPSVSIAPMIKSINGDHNDSQFLSADKARDLFSNEKSHKDMNGSPVMYRKLPQQEIPKPKTRMKSINWSKITSEKIISSLKPNLWALVAAQHESDYHFNVDFNELEDLFRQPSNSSAPNSCPGSPRVQRRPVSSEFVGSPFNSLERKVIKRQSGEYQLPNELQLLDGKKSLNVNIFLKQYRESTEELIKKISKGEHKEIGTERLKSLLKILPEANEIELLKKNEEECHRMPIAEKFLLNVINISNYKLKIEAMLLKEEFESIVTYLEPAIESVRKAAKEIKESKELHELLYLILVSGNFLNSGGYAGDAAGFKMMSLLKLPEIRANKPGVNLIHYVAMQAEKKGLSNFVQQLPSLEEASKISIENLRIEVNCLSNKMEKLREQIANQKEDSIHKEMQSFLDSSEKEVKKLSITVGNHLNDLRIEMAEFLCEDVQHFKLEECFRIFASFCQRFKLAIDENERRRDNEMKLEARKSNSQLKKLTQSSDSDNFLMESSLTPNNSSHSLTNSLNSSLSCDSKLKRRSRRGSQDEDIHNNLLEFLRTANDLNGSDIPVFGGSFRRMGSGRRSRSSNTITDSELNNRERNVTNVSESINKDRIEEIDTNENNFRRNTNFRRSTDFPTRTTEGDSDEDLNQRKAFDRFSPLRRTLSCKPSEMDNRLSKRFNRFERNENLLKSDQNNNNFSEPQNNEQNLNENNQQKESTSSPTHLRQFWVSKQTNESTISMPRPSTLHLTNHHNSQQPTAIITPTKLIRTDESGNTELLSPVLALETDRLSRMGCLPRRTSLSSPSNATAAAIVTPLQINEKLQEKEQIPVTPLRSKLPVRKAPLTPLPLQRKNGENNKTGIPLPSRNPIKNTNGVTNSRITNPIPNARTYRSPSTVSRTNLTSEKGSVASMKRSAQILSPNRSFMKQTSSSAAKNRNYSRY